MEFIPIAEEIGLILSIGRWVLETACRQAQGKRDLQPDRPPLVLAVNLSVQQLSRATSRRRWRRSWPCVQATSDTPARVHRVDRHHPDLHATRRVCRALKQLGVEQQIDDFGAGYSSLAHLRQLPVDALKVDRSFVEELARDTGAVAVVRSITGLAHELGMQVTVEGIETREQLMSVLALRCDRGQGYYFAPLPAEDLTRLWLAAPVEALGRTCRRYGGRRWFRRPAAVVPVTAYGSKSVSFQAPSISCHRAPHAEGGITVEAHVVQVCSGARGRRSRSARTGAAGRPAAGRLPPSSGSTMAACGVMSAKI
ncbi:MAG: EAL domain-containing protein [Dehalococcoidia bacterium]